jgi:hypothetical protein
MYTIAHHLVVRLVLSCGHAYATVYAYAASSQRHALATIPCFAYTVTTAQCVSCLHGSHCFSFCAAVFPNEHTEAYDPICASHREFAAA